MSISIATVFDPLSDSASRMPSSTPSIIMQSDQGRLLQHELTRYCTGQISGRSFLIAGHRGAGKTTMVLDALRRVAAGLGPDDLRPLVVHLHGPSLFEMAGDESKTPATPSEIRDPPEPADPDKRAKRQARAQKSAEEEGYAERLARRALVQIILGLHRATIKEFAVCYRQNRLAYADVVPFDTDSQMLVAQFEMELLEDPSAARLFEFYKRGGALRYGVLFGSDRVVKGQTSLELVALNGICNAHQRISGDLRRTEKEHESRTTEKTLKRVVEIKGSEVFKPIAAVLAGAAVAGGAAAAEGFSLGTAILGTLVTLAASFFVSRSSTEISRRERHTDTAFIPDLSLRTLDRLMPVLIDRLHAAGLAPVMIVDELDKVDGLSERIVNVVDCLKKLMAEGVFSCFLTDRSYIEHLRIMDRDTAYARAYSYFSHPLMIAYRPADFDAYLDRLLQPGTGNAEDENDRDVLKWVLRRRCELHAMKLNRQITSMRGDQNVLAFPGGRIRSAPASQMDLTFQVVIELELMRTDVQAWLAGRPTMQQTVYDSLYFLPDDLMKGGTQIVFKLNPTRQQYETASLRDWLETRMNLAEARSNTATSGTALTDDDIHMCQSIVHGIAEKLALRSKAHISAEWKKVSEDAAKGGVTVTEPTAIVIGEMLLDDQALLALHPSADGVTREFKWRYFNSGMPRPRADAVDIQTQVREARKLAIAVREIEANLHKVFAEQNETVQRPPGELLNWLAEPAYVLDTSPTWASVADSILEVEKERPYPGVIPNAWEQIKRYHQLLVAATDRILLTLQSAAFLSGLSSGTTVRDRMEGAIRLLSSALRFREALADERAAAVRDFQQQCEQMQPPIAWGKHNGVLKLEDPGVVDLANAAVAAGQKLKAEADWQQINTTAWEQLFRRVPNFVRTGKDVLAEVPEILSAARGEGPTKIIPIALTSVTLNQWTRILLAPLARPASSGTPDSVAHEPPLWVAALALRQLGIASLGPEWHNNFRSFLQDQRSSEVEQANIDELLGQHAIWSGETRATANFMLVVRRNGSSATDKFTATPKRGLALVLTAKQLLQFPRGPLLIRMAGETPWRIMWEHPSDAEGDRTVLRKALEGSGQAFAEGWLYPVQGPNLRQPCVVDPQNADDVFNVIGSSSARSSPPIGSTPSSAPPHRPPR